MNVSGLIQFDILPFLSMKNIFVFGLINSSTNKAVDSGRTGDVS